MKKKMILSAGLLLFAAGLLYGAPGDYPLTVNSQAQSLPQLVLQRSSERSIEVTFKDGATASDITGYTVFMSWSTNQYASTISTATCSIVTATSGVARCTFSATALNYTPGRYFYEVGVSSNSVPTVYRNGTLIIQGSPYSTGGAELVWGTNYNWASVTQYLNTITAGPYRPGTNITMTANTDGSADVHFNVASQARGDVAVFDGTNWVRVANGTTGQTFTAHGAGLLPSWTAAGAGDFKADGSVPLTGNGNAGGNGWTNLAAGTADDHAVNMAQINASNALDRVWATNASAGSAAALYLPLAGGAMSGNINMVGNNITDAGILSAGGEVVGIGEMRLWDNDGSYMRWIGTGLRQYQTDHAGSATKGTWTIKELNIVLDGIAIRGSAATNDNEFATLAQLNASNAVDRAYADTVGATTGTASSNYTDSATNALGAVAHDNDHGSLDGLADNDHPQYYNMGGATNWGGALVDGDINMGVDNSITNFGGNGYLEFQTRRIGAGGSGALSMRAGADKTHDFAANGGIILYDIQTNGYVTIDTSGGGSDSDLRLDPDGNIVAKQPMDFDGNYATNISDLDVTTSIQIGGGAAITNFSATSTTSNDVEVLTSKAVQDAIAAGGGGSADTAFTNHAYRAGMWTTYTATNQVTFGPGQIMCAGNMYELTTNYLATVAVTSANDYVYWYLDDSASTGTSVILYNDFTEPLTNAAYGLMNYHPTSTDDRLIQAHYTTNIGCLATFVDHNGTVNPDTSMQCASAMNPDDTWQTPDDDEGDGFLPVGTTHAYIIMSAADIDGTVECGVTTKEMADTGANPALGNFGEYSSSLCGFNSARVSIQGRMAVGRSRKLRVYGENDDDNALYLFILQYVMEGAE